MLSTPLASFHFIKQKQGSSTPYTRKQVKLLLSDGSPLSDAQQAKMRDELHADPSMGHAKKGSAELKKGSDSMAKLTSAKREALPKSTFGLPGSRKYPMPDASHAANAKARATQQVNAGRLSPASASKIRAKANQILSKSR